MAPRVLLALYGLFPAYGVCWGKVGGLRAGTLFGADVARAGGGIGGSLNAFRI